MQNHLREVGLGDMNLNLDLEDIQPDSKIYVSRDLSNLSVIQDDAAEYLQRTQQQQQQQQLRRDNANSLNSVSIRPPMAIWSEGMDDWLTITHGDLRAWVANGSGQEEIPSLIQRTTIGRGAAPDVRRQVTPYLVDVCSVFINVMAATRAFVVTVSYIGALIAWSVYEITPFSPVLALMASVTTFAPNAIRISFLLYVIQIIALVQWTFGIAGVSIAGEWSPYFSTWEAEAEGQQWFAWLTMLSVGMLRESRADVSEAARSEQNAYFSLLVGMLRIGAAVTLTVCGLYRASLINLAYALVGVFLLVWRVSSKRVWKSIFIVSSMIICVSLVLYIIPPGPIKRFLTVVLGDTATEDDSELDHHVVRV